MLEPLSTLCVSFSIFYFIADNISISMYIMCYYILVQHFEPPLQISIIIMFLKKTVHEPLK